MRRGFIVVAAALAFAGAARAAPPSVDARAYIVLNATSGKVLAQSNAHERLPVASITKLMTVLVALQHLSPDAKVKVTAQAAHVGEERIPLHAGQLVSVHDLLEGALIQSANDAADALAAGSANGDIAQFVFWMNEQAQELGLHDTHYARADGLDAPGHVSSAFDVARLAEQAMALPVVRAIVRKRTDTIENGTVVLHTWNDLLGVFPGLVGVKTGHTADAGWCEVAAVVRPGYTIYAVILGSPTRARRDADLGRLLAWAVSRYRTLDLVGPGPVAEVALPYGRAPLALVSPRPLVKLVAAGHPIVQRIVAPSAVSLPVRRGETLGRIEIWSGNRLLGTRPLVAARSVPRPGLGGRLRWYAKRTVKALSSFIP